MQILREYDTICRHPVSDMSNLLATRLVDNGPYALGIQPGKGNDEIMDTLDVALVGAKELEVRPIRAI